MTKMIRTCLTKKSGCYLQIKNETIGEHHYSWTPPRNQIKAPIHNGKQHSTQSLHDNDE